MKKLLHFHLPIFLSVCLLVTAGFFWYSQTAQAAFGTPAAGDRCYNSATSGTTVACTITNQPSAGDVIVFFGNAFNSLTISSVKDNAGTPNTFTIPTGTNLTSGCDETNGSTAGPACMAYLIEPNGSGGKTFTFTASNTCGTCSIFIDRFTVTGGTAAVDNAQGGHGSASAITAPTITVSGSNELIWGGCTDNNTCTGKTGLWTLEGHGLGAFGEGAEFQTSVSANTAVGFTGSSATDPWDSTGISFSLTATAATTPCSGVTKTGLTVCGGTLLVKGGCLVVGGPGGCGGGRPTAISLVEVKGAQSADGVAASVVNFTTNTTAGELILVFKTDTNGAEFTPTDNKGDTYTKVFEVDNISTHADYALWYAANVPSGVNQVTASTANAPNGEGIIVAHYTGIAAAPLDVSTSTPIHCSTCQVGNPGGQSSPWASNNITTTQSNELLVGLDFCGDANCSPVAAQDSYWTTQKTQGCRNCNGQLLIYGDKIESSIVTKNSSGTGGGAGNNFPAIATFKSQ